MAFTESLCVLKLALNICVLFLMKATSICWDNTFNSALVRMLFLLDGLEEQLF